MNVKIVLIGNSGVGKTTTVRKATNNTLTEVPTPTLGAAYASLKRKCGEKEIQLQNWDTAGQEKYRSIAPMYFRGVQIAVLMYSVTDPYSFQAIEDWHNDLLQQVEGTIVKFLVANKIDCEDKRVVTIEEGREKAGELDAIFYEVSAKSGRGVVDLFDEITSQASENVIKVQHSTVAVNESNPAKKKECC